MLKSEVAQLPQPHIFQPERPVLPRDPGQLFNLHRRSGYYNAEARTAMLRRAKQPPHDELLVDFSSLQVEIALRAAGIPLATGDWPWQATVSQERLSSEGPWTAAYWRNGKAFDYLEIEMPLSGGWKLQRQMLLAREDRFLLLADALISSEEKPIEIRYSSSLPLAAGAGYCPAGETREGWLEIGAKRRATVVAPALAEWRCEFCHAELREADGCLTLQQAALGRNLYAPIWIDLDPRRLKRPVTWRRLTIAENFAEVGRDVAAAYRIQAGREQWLIYRSLAPPANRSVLGYNTLKSFLCLRIAAGGKIERIIEIE